MKHIYKKVLSFLTIICCLAGSLSTVYASESGEVPRVVFVNEEKAVPDLYIGKTVESPEGYTAPEEDTFTFLLKLGGEPAGRRTYVLCDQNGTELTKDQVKEILGYAVEQNSFSTSNGTFTLRAGLMARFSGLGVGTEYEVSEVLDSDSYQQIVPAGGQPAQGILEAKGAEVVFTNRYLPKLQEGTAKLEVTKTIEFPAGFEAPGTPDFTFRLTLNRQPYAGKPYSLRDDASGKILSQENTTTADGTFTLKGGQTAVFENDDLEAGLDYEVTEVQEQMPEGWHTIGAASQKGALTAPVTLASFHNSEVSFVVTKRMEDSARPDKAFTFQLSKADGSLWSGAEYYLYDLRGSLISAPGTSAPDESTPSEGSGTGIPEGSTVAVRTAAADGTNVSNEGTPAATAGTDAADGTANPAVSGGGAASVAADGKYTTAADGTFTLQPGQAAVFTGLAPGTGYSVSEVGDPDYIQVLPLEVEGYTGRTVKESPVETLPFINQKAPEIPTLAVTKVVENLKGDAPGAQDEFHFTLKKKNGETWEPVNNASYTITVGSSEISRATDGNGAFTLKANETARFTKLLSGEYQVTEVLDREAMPGYQIKADANSSADTNPAVQSGTLGKSGTTSFLFTNTYQPDKLDLALTKQSPSGTTLEGAVFQLRKENAQGELIGTATTDAAGTLTFEALPAGTYLLQETIAPPGYRVLEQPVTITITRNAENYEPQAEVSIGTEDKVTQRLVSESGSRDRLELTVTDQYVYELPSTGGPGTVPYNRIGTALLLLSALLFLHIRRPRRS